MKLKALIGLVIMAVVMALISSVVRAEEPADDLGDLAQQNRICYVDSYEDSLYPIPVVDTWYIPDVTVVNPGSTSGTYMPCVATACPDGMVLISGNVCAGEETSPFAHIPVLTDEVVVAVGEPPVPEFLITHSSLSGWMNGDMYFGGQL